MQNHYSIKFSKSERKMIFRKKNWESFGSETLFFYNFKYLASWFQWKCKDLCSLKFWLQKSEDSALTVKMTAYVDENQIITVDKSDPYKWLLNWFWCNKYLILFPPPFKQKSTFFTFFKEKLTFFYIILYILISTK